MNHIERAQQRWEALSREQREQLLRMVERDTMWARSFDLYGDMPKSVSDAIVKFSATHPLDLECICNGGWSGNCPIHKNDYND